MSRKRNMALFVFWLAILMVVISTSVGAEQERSAADPNPDRLRPSCKVFAADGRYNLTSRFFVEQRKIVPAREVVKVGDPLFYASYQNAQRFAVASEHIMNRDPSPLNSNWDMMPERKHQVYALLSGDGENYFYLIENTARFTSLLWVSDMSGMLCSNGLSLSADGKIGSGGMPKVYQGQPLIFETIASPTSSPKSVSVILKEMDGATVTLEMNALSGGRSFFKEVATFDLFAGTANLKGIIFEFERTDGGMRLNSVTEPPNLDAWLVFDLNMPR